MKNVAYDIYNVMDLYMKHFAELKEELKKPIFSLCVLWNENVHHEPEKKQKYTLFIDKNKERFKECCIENIIMYCFPRRETHSIEWDEELFEKVILKYVTKKIDAKYYSFPTNLETIMYLMASDFLMENDEKRKYWAKKANYNSTNNKEVLQIVNLDLSVKEKIEEIWNIIYK